MEGFDTLRLENQLCFPLYAASREVIRQYRPLLDPLGLTYTQYITMMVLWQAEQISVKELGNKLFLDSGTLTPLLKTLEGRGYLRRKRSTEDERVVLIELTGEGRALREQVRDVPKQVGTCIKLAPEEAMELYRLLYKVLDGLENQ